MLGVHVVFVTDSGEGYRAFVRGVKEIIHVGFTINEFSKSRRAFFFLQQNVFRSRRVKFRQANLESLNVVGWCRSTQRKKLILRRHPETRGERELPSSLLRRYTGYINCHRI